MNHNTAHGLETAAMSGVLLGIVRTPGGSLKAAYLFYLLLRTGIFSFAIASLIDHEGPAALLPGILLSLAWSAFNSFQSWRRFKLVKPYLEAFIATGRDEFLDVLGPAHMSFSLASLEVQEPILPVAEYHFDNGRGKYGVVTDELRCTGMLGNIMAPVWWIRLQIRMKEREFLKTGAIKRRKGLVFKVWSSLAVIFVSVGIFFHFSDYYLLEPYDELFQYGLLMSVFLGFVPALALGLLLYILKTYLMGEYRYGRLFRGLGKVPKVDYVIGDGK